MVLFDIYYAVLWLNTNIYMYCTLPYLHIHLSVHSSVVRVSVSRADKLLGLIPAAMPYTHSKQNLGHRGIIMSFSSVCQSNNSFVHTIFMSDSIIILLKKRNIKVLFWHRSCSWPERVTPLFLYQ